MTDAKYADVRILDVLIPEPGSIYLFDRAYVDFWRLYQLTNNAREARGFSPGRDRASAGRRSRGCCVARPVTGVVARQLTRSA